MTITTFLGEWEEGRRENIKVERISFTLSVYIMNISRISRQHLILEKKKTVTAKKNAKSCDGKSRKPICHKTTATATTTKQREKKLDHNFLPQIQTHTQLHAHTLNQHHQSTTASLIRICTFYMIITDQ